MGPGQGFFPLQAGVVKDQESEGMKHRIRGWTGKEVEAKGGGKNSVENREVRGEGTEQLRWKIRHRGLEGGEAG